MKRTDVVVIRSGFADLSAESLSAKELCGSLVFENQINLGGGYKSISLNWFNSNWFNSKGYTSNLSQADNACIGVASELSCFSPTPQTSYFSFSGVNGISAPSTPRLEEFALQAKKDFTLFWCTFAKHSF